MPSTKTPRVNTEVLRTVKQNNSVKAVATSTARKPMSVKLTKDNTPVKAYGIETRRRTSIAPIPKFATPKAKENKTGVPGSVTKSGKKSWKRRPKPAHSGVPVPEKMRKLFEKQLREAQSQDKL